MKKKFPKNSDRAKQGMSFENNLSLHSEIENLKAEIDRLNKENEANQERLQDLEIQMNLLTRLLTTLCIEKFGMRVGVLKRLIKRIENEAIRDSQIHHLESLYKLSKTPEKKDELPPPSADKDPWDEIS